MRYRRLLWSIPIFVFHNQALVLPSSLLANISGGNLEPTHVIPADGVEYEHIHVKTPQNTTCTWQNPGIVEMVHYSYPNKEVNKGFDADALRYFLDDATSQLAINKTALGADWDWPLPESAFRFVQEGKNGISLTFERGYEVWVRDLSWRDALEVIYAINYYWVTAFRYAEVKVPQSEFLFLVNGNSPGPKHGDVMPFRLGQGILKWSSTPSSGTIWGVNSTNYSLSSHDPLVA